MYIFYRKMLFTSILWDGAIALPRTIKPAVPSNADCEVWTIFLSAAATHLAVTC